MKKKLILVAVVLVMALGIGAWFARGAEADDAEPYRMGEVAMGTVESTVTSTGRLTAIQSVAVGTQVSGMVIALFADYNDRVREGQLIARIDPIIQQQALRNAEANLERVRAALAQAVRDSVRNQTLFDQQIITQAEMDQVEYSLTVARANLTSAEVSREQASRNLAYTDIYSPIDGVVVERNVEIGQTVAASMSAPQLYLLATDLAKIEILANVDESDIGSIRNGMPVRFTVSAYPNDRFEGVVRQVRLSSATQENVVNYTAVISVDNEDLRLVPGMTAEVDFIVERAEEVFMVPNAALRFRATEEMIAQLTDSAMIRIAQGMGGRGGMAGMRAAGPGGPGAGTGDATRPAGQGGNGGSATAQVSVPGGGPAGPGGGPAGAAAAGAGQRTGAQAGAAGAAGQARGAGFGPNAGMRRPGGGAAGTGAEGMAAGGVRPGGGQGMGPGGGQGARPGAGMGGGQGAAGGQGPAGPQGAPDGTYAGASGAAQPNAAASAGVFVLGGGATPAGRTRAGVAPLWYIKDGKIGVLQVRTGISDGTNTEISGAELEEGMQIIVGLNQPDPAAAGGTTNPFQQQRGGFGGQGGGPVMIQGGGGPGGGGFGGGGGGFGGGGGGR